MKDKQDSRQTEKQLTVADLEQVSGAGWIRRQMEVPASEDVYGKDEEIRAPFPEL
jgi:hypothetical protein